MDTKGVFNQLLRLKEVVYEQMIALSSDGIPKNSKVGFEIFNEQSFIGKIALARNYCNQ